MTLGAYKSHKGIPTACMDSLGTLGPQFPPFEQWAVGFLASLGYGQQIGGGALRTLGQ